MLSMLLLHQSQTVIERTFKLEERMEVVDEKIKVANHRLEDLEHEKQIR